MFKSCCGECGECWYIGNPRTCACPDKNLERTWVGLTVDEYHTIRNSTWEVSEAIRFTEAKLKEKNT
jgi:hypothetical protein